MKKSSSTLVFSTVGVVALFLILVAVNFITGALKQRVDLTQERAFTLSTGTRAILNKLDAPVQIRLYVTQGAEMPVDLRNFASEVEDMLGELQQASRFVRIQKLDPAPDSDAEDSANLDGITGMPLPGGEQLYLGLSVSMLDRKTAIPVLLPERARLLEYEIARAISQVMVEKKPVIGVMSPLDVFGSMNPMLMQMGMQSRPPWTFLSELKQNFDVREVDPSSDSIPDDIEVLVVVHPKGISEAAQYALDQFVLRGGRLIAALDPYCLLDRQGANPMGGGGPPTSSTLEKLLPAWGITFDSTRTVADLEAAARTPRGRQPALLALDPNAFDASDPITGGVDNMVLAFAGAYGGKPADGLTQTVLVHTSTNAQLVEPSMAETSGESIIRDFAATGVQYPLAVRLSGKFKTAFPNGKPMKPADQNNPAAKDAAKDDKPKPAEAAGLKESSKETSVILLGDADFLQDPLTVREVPNLFNQRVLVPANGNLSFAQSAVEQMAGDSNLIAVRSRASRERPFTVVRQMQAEAEKKFSSTISQLENELRQTESKLNELQQVKQAGQEYILSPEQQKELANFQKKEAEVRKRIKEVRRDLAKGIDTLETQLKWLNIALMPALVAVFGIVFFLIKRKRAAAR